MTSVIASCPFARMQMASNTTTTIRKLTNVFIFVDVLGKYCEFVTDSATQCLLQVVELGFDLVDIRDGIGDDNADEFSETMPQSEYKYPRRTFIFLELGAQLGK